MQDIRETIPLFFSVDDRYVPYLGVMINSLIASASPKYDYKAIILYQDITERNQKRLKEQETASFTLEFVPMANVLERQMTADNAKLRGDYSTLTIYFRLFIADMFPQFDKAIYLDADMLAPGDISELYEMELGDNLIAAAPDTFTASIPEGVNYDNNAVGVPAGKYVNSGVLLLNLKQFRATNFSKQFLELFNRYHFSVIAPDQDYLNALAYQKTLYLDPKWNDQTAVPEMLTADPKIIHYNLFKKPTHYENVPHETFFWETARKSGFYDELLEMKKHYSSKDVQQDQTNLLSLIKMANSVPDEEITFKKVLNGGE